MLARDGGNPVRAGRLRGVLAECFGSDNADPMSVLKDTLHNSPMTLQLERQE
jgi:hypothetical protein